MVFKELEIQGFKSFPDKVKIRFDEGVTGVVGPNGSGKSNLSDAVRWVLGETSTRQLRAAGKMEDVIFGGTRRRGAMGFAQVRLTLDNSAHTLDLDADEAVIGRKYYRSGESEYTINGQLCRLKDIYELLLDTGIGRDGYPPKMTSSIFPAARSWRELVSPSTHRTASDRFDLPEPLGPTTPATTRPGCRRSSSRTRRKSSAMWSSRSPARTTTSISWWPCGSTRTKSPAARAAARRWQSSTLPGRP